MIVELWTDGSGHAKGGPAGWAYVLRAIDGTGEVLAKREAAAPIDDATNNGAELLAVIHGLEALKRPTAVTVITDSEYVMRAFTDGWLDRWQRNRWRSRSGPVKNRRLWERLLRASAPHTVTWRHVKGHVVGRRCSCGWTGDKATRTCPSCRGRTERYDVHPLNARCDELAGQARRNLVEALA